MSKNNAFGKFVLFCAAAGAAAAGAYYYLSKREEEIADSFDDDDFDDDHPNLETAYRGMDANDYQLEEALQSSVF